MRNGHQKNADYKTGRADPGAGEHLCRQPAAGGLHCQPDRGGPGRKKRRADRLARPCAHWRAGDAAVVGGGLAHLALKQARPAGPLG